MEIDINRIVTESFLILTTDISEIESLRNGSNKDESVFLATGVLIQFLTMIFLTNAITIAFLTQSLGYLSRIVTKLEHSMLAISSISLQKI